MFAPSTSLLLPIITSIKADIVAWGVAFIGVALTIYAYHRIEALVQTRESANAEADEADEAREEHFEAVNVVPNRAEADYDYDFRYK